MRQNPLVMNVEEFRDYCLSLPGATEKMPFLKMKDDGSRDLLCFYVGRKWFCFVNIATFGHCCLKTAPEMAITLREQYQGIRPAWHMNKRMWNDVYLHSDVPDSKIKELVTASYQLVRASLPAKEREKLP